jgi:ribosomal protein S10
MKYQLIIRSLDKITIDLYLFYIKAILKKINFNILSVQYLPIKKKRISILKSPHVNKKAVDQFEYKLYRVLLTFTIFLKPNQSIVSFFLINKPKNIKVTLKYKST